MYGKAILFILVFVPIHFTNSKDSTVAETEERIQKPSLVLLTFSTSSGVQSLQYSKCAIGSKLNIIALKGSGSKLNLIKLELEEITTNNYDPVVLYTGSYDSLLLGTETEILAQFKSANSDILFSAGTKFGISERQSNCTVEEREDAGAFIGRASAVLKLIISKPVNGPDEAFVDTLLYTSELSVGLDTGHIIFQNVLEGAGSGSCSQEQIAGVSLGDLELDYTKNVPLLLNRRTQTRPLVLLGDPNPFSRSVLNTFGDYLCGNWQLKCGRGTCTKKALSMRTSEELPTVLLGIFLARPMPFLQRFFSQILNLDYPKEKLHLVVYNGNGRNEAVTEAFIIANNISYATVFVVDRSAKPWEARNLALKRAIDQKQAYYFSLDGEARLDRRTVLRELIEQNLTAVSPLLVQPYGSSSNYWGALSEKGRPIRALNYEHVLSWEHRGLWTVPCVNKAYLLNITGLRTTPQLSIEFSRRNSEVFCAGQNKSFAERVMGTLRNLFAIYIAVRVLI